MAASTYFVPTRFTWRFGGQAVRGREGGRADADPDGMAAVARSRRAPPPPPPPFFLASLTQRHALFTLSQVHLCGSFTRWVETVPMAPVPGVAGEFSVVVHLPPG